MFLKKKSTVFFFTVAILITTICLYIYKSSYTKYGQLDFKITAMLKVVNLINLDLKHTKHKELRDTLNNLIKILPFPLDKVKKIQDLKIPFENKSIPIRIYTPETKKESLPIIIYYHGGGMVLWNLDAYDGLCRSLAKKTEALVFSVDYSLAPENPFPTAIEESYYALEWIAKNAKKFKGNPAKIAVAGDSAGGTLATVMTILARDRQGPKIVAQTLFYPVTNFSNTNTKSYKDFATGYLLTKDMMQWFRKAYLPYEKDWSNPLASPLLTKNLKGLPPAFIIIGQFDPLRDEGKSYAKKLEINEVPVILKKYPDVVHAFMSIEILSQTDQAKNETAIFLNKYFQNL